MATAPSSSSSSSCLYLHAKNRKLLWNTICALLTSRRATKTNNTENHFQRILEQMFDVIVQHDPDFSNVSCFDKLETIETLQKWNLRTVQVFLQEHGDPQEQKEKKVHFDLLAATSTSTSTTTTTNEEAPARLKKEEVRHLQIEFEELQQVYESKKHAMPPSTSSSSPPPPPPSSPCGLLEDRPLENMEEVLQRHIEERNRLLLA